MLWYINWPPNLNEIDILSAIGNRPVSFSVQVYSGEGAANLFYKNIYSGLLTPCIMSSFNIFYGLHDACVLFCVICGTFFQTAAVQLI